jgi:hypothetical protein
MTNNEVQLIPASRHHVIRFAVVHKITSWIYIARSITVAP